MRAMMDEEHQQRTRWQPDLGKLALWTPETMGCVIHVPFHWVALAPPQSTHNEQAAALLCDSLWPQPYALSVDEVGELLALIGTHQATTNDYDAGAWSVHVVERTAHE